MLNISTWISWHLDILDSEEGFPSWLHLWNLDEKNTTLFTSLKVFVVFDSTKVCWKQQKQNKQTLSLILHQKLSKSIYYRVLEIDPPPLSTQISANQGGAYYQELFRIWIWGVRLLTWFSSRFCLRIQPISQKNRLRRSEGGALINFWFWESELRGCAYWGGVYFQLLRAGYMSFAIPSPAMSGDCRNRCDGRNGQNQWRMCNQRFI